MQSECKRGSRTPNWRHPGDSCNRGWSILLSQFCPHTYVRYVTLLQARPKRLRLTVPGTASWCMQRGKASDKSFPTLLPEPCLLMVMCMQRLSLERTRFHRCTISTTTPVILLGSVHLCKINSMQVISPWLLLLPNIQLHLYVACVRE